MTKKSILRLLQASLMCCLAVLFTACDDVFGNEDNPMSAYLSMSDKPVTLKAGDTYRRKAISVTTAVVEYSSSDTNVATVDGEGVVTAIAEGTATITATATGYSSQNGKKIYQPASVSYVVTVVPATVPATSLTLNKTMEVLAKNGDALTITATVTPSDATFTWESSDANVATVENGVVTPVGAGIATITAKSGDVKATCEVFVGNEVDVSSGNPIQNFDILKGTQNSSSITIPDGCKVAFNGVTTNKQIICEGTATIILADGSTNTVTETSVMKAGIQIGGTGKTLTINGETAGDGKLTVQGGMGAAGIGTNMDENGGNILINGGTVTATGGDYSAGIGTGGVGSGTKTFGTITINGGTVTAQGGSNGAGIGTGYAYYATNECGAIMINGGAVTATGGMKGAGIGTGYADGSTNTCGAITINGGAVTATGGDYSAGIGGGYADNATNECGAIMINGGTVTAEGGAGGAGIGTGAADYSTNKCSDITINGGAVTATGGMYGAGIGTAYAYGSTSTNECGAITIGTSVTSVTAKKSSSNPGPNSIGKGYAASGGTQTCGTITIGGVVKAQSDFTAATYTYEP